ncbi:MAG: hypothetical protein ACREXY_15405 [Gammaproteobacteria bacterium]
MHKKSLALHEQLGRKAAALRQRGQERKDAPSPGPDLRIKRVSLQRYASVSSSTTSV